MNRDPTITSPLLPMLCLVTCVYAHNDDDDLDLEQQLGEKKSCRLFDCFLLFKLVVQTEEKGYSQLILPHSNPLEKQTTTSS